jgi:hypothetical protein
MNIFRVKSATTLHVPGNSGNKYEASYRARSRCSHFSRERREQVLKLLAYLFPLFPGTGEDISHS